MLPKNKMVKARKALESLYDGKCTITEHQKVQRENKSTGFEDVVVLQDQPCRLSFSTISSTNETDTASHLVQAVKVFLAPDIVVKAGSKLDITQNGQMTSYKASGVPALYDTHQEIVLELFKGWA